MTSLSFRAKPRPRPVPNGRFIFIRWMIILLFCLLTVRLVYVQAFLRMDLSQRANRQNPGRGITKNLRAHILDRHGKILAESVQINSCFLDPSQIRDKSAVAQTMGRLLGINGSALLKQMKSKKSSFLWVKRNISANEVESLRAKKLKGVGFKKEWRRNYPLTPVAPHLLGLVGIDGRGLSGIEMQYNAALSGQATPLKADSLPAGHVQLTLDSQIQKVAERELEWGALKTNAKKGMVIVQRPTTGEILAMASWPPVSINPDNPPKPEDLRIPTIVDVFEPGSTLKIVTAVAAIEEKMIKPREVFFGENGKWKVKDITIHDHVPHAWMSFDDIFVFSSNIGTAKIADRLGKDMMFQYARLFGFGVYPGSGLPAEAKGLLRPPKKWSGVSKYAVSFGQEVSVTALQLAGAYSAIANGGSLMEPKIVKAILDEDNRPLWESLPSVVRRVASAETLHRVTEILAKVVEEGTGQNATVQWRKDLQVAGKTGTAQKFDNAIGRYNQHVNLISFCGFFPVSEPAYTIIVILDEPEGQRWGGVDAAPVFRRIAEQIFPAGKA